MSNRLVFTLLLFFISFSFFNAQNVDIPDANFKQALIDNDVDTNGDGEIQLSEAELTSYLGLVGRNISDITGIENFMNIEFLDLANNDITTIDLTNNLNIETLNVSFNDLTEINLGLNTKLEWLDVSVNSLSEIDISNCINLVELFASNNYFSEIDLRQNVNLKELDLSINGFTDLDVSKNSFLENIDAAYNNLSELDIDNNLLLEDLTLGYNNLSEIDLSNNLLLEDINLDLNSFLSIDFSNNVALKIININDNRLINIDVSQNVLLERFMVEGNELSELDLSNNSVLFRLSCDYNPLTYLNIKNGSKENEIGISDCPQLSNICCDREDLDLVQENILLENYESEFNTYCSVGPGGINNEISGSFYFDFNQNGCQDSFSLPYPKFTVSDSIGKGFFFGNEVGDYRIMLPQGSYEVSPVIENLEIFTISPPLLEFELEKDSDKIVQDFCLLPKELVQDLEITIIPLNQARPGFEAEYKIIYENKGTTVVSGDVILYYENDLAEYISAEPMEDKVSTSSISWEYEDLVPFEQRSIIVTMELNRPTDTPALNDGDILSYKVTIDPVDLLKQAPDNTGCFDQEVVNSFDPNDKRCLEGESVTEVMIGEYVHYMIRFENTGSAEAVNVIVTDSLDTSKFDISSIEVVEASHDVKIQIVDNQLAEFYFENILLPFDDANNDGYVVFKIRTLETLVIGDVFENTAQIYFDFNFPIITNTTNTSIEILSSTSTTIGNGFHMKVFPNPISDILYIQTTTNFNYNLFLYSLKGHLLKSWSNATKLDLSEFSRGAYLLELKDMSTGKSTTQRIVLQ